MQSASLDVPIFAYSYLRFSSPDQRAGDSIRRQTSLAAAYADEFGLKLNNDLTYEDFGISGFRGENAASGRLGDFLAAVSSGLVPVGSVLLVENLDRLSRDSALHAQNLLTQILLAGVSIVTLSDRRTYSADELRRDPMGLIFALINFIRANEESAIKSVRAKANWVAKRQAALTGAATGKCPAWLKLDHRTKSFVKIPERVDLVKKIFALLEQGYSFTGIAQFLNHGGYPSPKYDVPWTRHAVGTVISFSAVVGTYVPHYQDYHNGKVVRRPLKPIPNYYPAIISVEDFERAQARKRASYSGGRSPIGFLLRDLAVCEICGQHMKMVHRATQGPSMVCIAAAAGTTEHYLEIEYAPIDLALRRALPEMLKGFDLSDDRFGSSNRLRFAQNALDRARRANAAATVRNANEAETDTVRQALALAEEEMLDAVESFESRPTIVLKGKIATALECLAVTDASPSESTLINGALKGIFKSAHIDPTRKTIELAGFDGKKRQVTYVPR